MFEKKCCLLDSNLKSSTKRQNTILPPNHVGDSQFIPKLSNPRLRGRSLAKKSHAQCAWLVRNSVTLGGSVTRMRVVSRARSAHARGSKIYAHLGSVLKQTVTKNTLWYAIHRNFKGFLLKCTVLEKLHFYAKLTTMWQRSKSLKCACMPTKLIDRPKFGKLN